MTVISERINRFKPSLTVKISQRARELSRSGKKIISLSSGEPDFDTPTHIKDEAIKSINNGFTKYTEVDGIVELKDSIAKKFRKENNLNYSRDQITVGAGGKHVIYNLFMSTINKGDEIIIPAPYWVSYPDIVSLCNGIPIICETSIKNGFKIDPNSLSKLITKKTKWLILNSPCNPTGAVYSGEELKKISNILLKNPYIMVLSDDIYEHIIYGKRKFVNILNAEPKLYDRVFLVNGVSKAFSMTGWRIGYGAGSLEIIKAIAKIQSQSTTNPCSISQMAAKFALDSQKKFLTQWIENFQERKNFLLNFFNSTSGFNTFEPNGAFYLYVSCKGFINKEYDNKKINNDIDFCEFLIEKAGVAVVPGAAFGTSPFFRISYATSMDNLKDACDLISNAIKLLK